MASGAPSHVGDKPAPGKDSGNEPKLFLLEKFSGLNTKALRSGIEDQEFSWSENLMPIGSNNMRALPDVGASVYTAPPGRVIVDFVPFNIGVQTYHIVFLDNGTAETVNTLSTAVTTVTATPGTFYNGGALPDVSQFGDHGLVIVGLASANCYFAWDGTLYKPGDASPSWLNGNTPTVMPAGLSGTCIETYQSRVWVGTGEFFSFSAPSNGALFSTPGGSFPSTDSFLRYQYNAVKQANGFLYLLGDSSINVVSNVQTGGTPTITTFNNNNVDPQTSATWPKTVQAFGRAIVFANTSGVYALFGGTAEKISDMLDGVFQRANFSGGVTPSSAVATIYGIRCYIIMLSTIDPTSGVLRNLMFGWDGKKWFPASQSVPISTIRTQEINSNLVSWGSDGSSIYPMFQTPSTTLTKKVQSKLWSGSSYIVNKQVLRIYFQAFDQDGAGLTLSGTIDTESAQVTTAIAANAVINFLNDSGQLIQATNTLGQALFATVSQFAISGGDVSIYGKLVGVTMTTTDADFTIASICLLYREYNIYG